MFRPSDGKTPRLVVHAMGSKNWQRWPMNMYEGYVKKKKMWIKISQSNVVSLKPHSISFIHPMPYNTYFLNYFCCTPAAGFWLHRVSVCASSSTGMASAVRLPPFRRPQNVSAALSSSYAVRYRCHAAPLRPQRHREPGQQHHRVSHTCSETTAISDMRAVVAQLCFLVNCW